MKMEPITKSFTSPSYVSEGSRPIDIGRALNIVGPLGPNELRWLAGIATCSSVVIELGALLGRLTRALGDNALGWVFAIDQWPGREEYEMFQRNIKGLEEKVEVIHNQAKNAYLGLSLRLPQGADLVFISGTHSLQEIRDNILCYNKLICPGGILAGSGYGQKEHVDEIVNAQFRRGVVQRYESLWFVRV